ncbi:LysR substrate-binding domain-containing protein [Sinorhizobium sp. 7-81]|uniref:LysR family transcriptional regulator n=1 Tax=unclassified Sinorhizobium TaxID=2613772 RepID=UPI0024C4717D|nr:MULTISPECIES: LysR substrate-binding domain-containing protein [unclassified Sinorhizobium]MDK1389353.1 LysR substrate-binding domain-containing protein [Sinorhizobium sp. 7-81]MDK1492995.1 LysR substrate-binding domain-containing protein [Sinorhizobium sp. 8-89]
MFSRFLQLRHLRYFKGIVDAGSFCRAATAINVAQPALSQQIAALEAELGVPLLHRSVRGVCPTREGKALYREAASILQQVEQLHGIVRSTAGEPEGSVRVGMSSALAASFASAFVGACQTELPKVKMRLITGDFLHMRPLIESRALDICVVFEDEPAQGFARQPLFHQPLSLVRPAHAQDVESSVPLECLAELPLVLPTRPSTIRNALDRAFEAARVVPNCLAEVDTFSSALSLVKAGIASAIVPKSDLSDIAGHEDLIPVVIDPPMHMTACLISSRDLPLTSAAEAVSALLVTQVEKVHQKDLTSDASAAFSDNPSRGSATRDNQASLVPEST